LIKTSHVGFSSCGFVGRDKGWSPPPASGVASYSRSRNKEFDIELTWNSKEAQPVIHRFAASEASAQREASPVGAANEANEAGKALKEK